jgi:hypothetical protein
MRCSAILRSVHRYRHRSPPVTIRCVSSVPDFSCRSPIRTGNSRVAVGHTHQPREGSAKSLLRGSNTWCERSPHTVRNMDSPDDSCEDSASRPSFSCQKSLYKRCIGTLKSALDASFLPPAACLACAILQSMVRRRAVPSNSVQPRSAA